MINQATHVMFTIRVGGKALQPGARERGILPAARHGGIMNARYVLGLDQARNWLAASGWRSELPRGRSEYDSSRTSTLILGLMHQLC